MSLELESRIIKQAEPQFPIKELLVVPHRGRDLKIGWPAFGKHTYEKNLAKMDKTHSHLSTGERISFRPAIISESISAAAYGFGASVKSEIFDQGWLQTGYAVATQDGVFTNTQTTDEKALKEFLNNAEKVKGIYHISDSMVFAPYESFERGVQDCDAFSQGGLARALEHTSDRFAEKLRKIASPEFYKRGIRVFGFNGTRGPLSIVIGLESGSNDNEGMLDVSGIYLDCWGYGNGFAFGILKEDKEE